MDSAKKTFELWKLKKTLEFLKKSHSNEKCLISIVVGPGVGFAQVKKAIGDEPLVASNELMKKYLPRIEREFKELPEGKTTNFGIFFYISFASDVSARVAFEPAFPIPESALKGAQDGVILKVARDFYVNPIEAIINANEIKIGVVLLDSNGASVMVVKGATVEVIQRVATYLPRNNKLQYLNAIKTLVQKVGQLASQELCNEQGEPFVHHIIYGGTYDFRSEMKPEMFSEKLRPLVLKLVEVLSASEEEIPGAFAKNADVLAQSNRMAEEVTLIQDFFQKGGISGPKEVLEQAEKKNVAKLLVDPNRAVIRFVLKSPKDTKVVYEEHPRDFTPYQVVEQSDLLEYIIDHQHRFGIPEIQLITNTTTSEAFKFTHTAEGIGALLK